jgi:hypothetical protein
MQRKLIIELNDIALWGSALILFVSYIHVTPIGFRKSKSILIVNYPEHDAANSIISYSSLQL